MFARHLRARYAALLATALVLGPVSRRVRPSDQLSLDLNIPAYRLDVYEADTLRESMRVAVGMPKYKTPRGQYVITSIVWNPWWVPPESYWARNERVTPPGADNPMGSVKLFFQPLYFLHGTPFTQSLGSAASHGCVRMSNADARRLARIVYHAANPAASDSAIDEWVRDTVTTTRIEIEPVVPLRIRYDVAEVRGDTLVTYRDVYALGRVSYRLAIAALQRAGIDTAFVDSALLAGVVQRARQKPQRVLLDSLLKLP